MKNWVKVLFVLIWIVFPFIILIQKEESKSGIHQLKEEYQFSEAEQAQIQSLIKEKLTYYDQSALIELRIFEKRLNDFLAESEDPEAQKKLLKEISNFSAFGSENQVAMNQRCGLPGRFEYGKIPMDSCKSLCCLIGDSYTHYFLVDDYLQILDSTSHLKREVRIYEASVMLQTPSCNYYTTITGNWDIFKRQELKVSMTFCKGSDCSEGLSLEKELQNLTSAKIRFLDLKMIDPYFFRK